MSTGCCGRLTVQQRSRWLGFPLAVIRTFADDNGAALATVVADNAFFALFPLLLMAEAQSWCSAGGACGCCCRRRGKQERSLRTSSASNSKSGDTSEPGRDPETND